MAANAIAPAALADVWRHRSANDSVKSVAPAPLVPTVAKLIVFFTQLIIRSLRDPPTPL